ncbi:MAG TPA: hypothetical protein VFM65_04365 [Flavobacteriaceae bacterium]|nr:hypothetical protein [Flavobacteriaceae bacterium]
MKIKFITALIVLGGIFACDDSKQVKSNEFIYELSMHQLYLKTEAERLKDKLENLEKGTDAYAATKDSINHVGDFLDHIEQKLVEIDPAPIPVPTPFPPGPLPCNCEIPLSLENQVVFIGKLENFSFSILNDKGEKIGGLEKVKEYETKTDILHVYKIQASPVKNARIEVTKFSTYTQEVITYSLKTGFKKFHQ